MQNKPNIQRNTFLQVKIMLANIISHSGLWCQGSNFSIINLYMHVGIESLGRRLKRHHRLKSPFLIIRGPSEAVRGPVQWHTAQTTPCRAQAFFLLTGFTVESSGVTDTQKRNSHFSKVWCLYVQHCLPREPQKPLFGDWIHFSFSITFPSTRPFS